MADVKKVAEYFLYKSEENSSRSITPLKLQKLLYFAQGIHLSSNDCTPLFEEELLRWAHGSVSVSVYDAYKKYGYFSIPKILHFNTSHLSETELCTVDNVWKVYGDMDGKFLEELIHQEDPWITTPPKEVITKEKMFNHFKNEKLGNQEARGSRIIK